MRSRAGLSESVTIRFSFARILQLRFEAIGLISEYKRRVLVPVDHILRHAPVCVHLLRRGASAETRDDAQSDSRTVIVPNHLGTQGRVSRADPCAIRYQSMTDSAC